MNRVEVLLSTYNGESYIQAQLNSLSGQRHGNWSLRVRDDGSSDATAAVVERYRSSESHNVVLEKGENLGVIPSFFELIRQADETADFFCFCDQDDVWLPDKMERAAGRLSNVKAGVPAMVFTSTQLTDDKLRPIKVWPAPPTKGASFYNALYQNIAVGATVTFNRAALQLIRAHMPQTDKVLMHDWWLYLCVSAFGETIYDPQPSILYRQHGGNAVGGEVSAIGKLNKKWGSFRKHRGAHKLVAQAREFHRLYGGQLGDSEKLRQLEAFIAPRTTPGQRAAYLRSSKLYRQSALENRLFRLLILSGYI